MMEEMGYDVTVEELLQRRDSEWELRGSKAIGSFDESGRLGADRCTWVADSTPREDWRTLIALANVYVELVPK